MMMFDLNVAQRQEFNPWPHSPNAKALRCVPAGAVVLDVGCARGHMARVLTEKGCKVHGIEIDPPSAEEARKYCVEVLNTDLDTNTTPALPRDFFDAVLVLDVLEHLKRPDLALTHLSTCLKPKGTLICSLPNVARIEHRLALLAGRFNYSDCGALSKGHLRFFTRHSATLLLQNAGFVIDKVDYTGFASMFPVLPTLTAYQFLFLCSRKTTG